jgi:hypothetical protein
VTDTEGRGPAVVSLAATALANAVEGSDFIMDARIGALPAINRNRPP